MGVILLSTIAGRFEKKHGTMSGLIKVGTGVGMLIIPIFVTWVITTYSWRTAFTALDILILIIAISLAQFLVRDPAKKGQFPDNEIDTDTIRRVSTENGPSFLETVHTSQFWTVCAVFFLFLVCAGTILLHIVQHAIDFGISASSAASVLATIGGVSIAGRFLMGSAGDRIGSKMALFICLLFLLTGLLWLQLAKTLWMFYVFAAFYGFAHGGFFAVGSPLVAGLFGTGSDFSFESQAVISRSEGLHYTIAFRVPKVF